MAKGKTSAHEIPTDAPPLINWLRAWDPLDAADFNLANDIAEFKRRIRVYVRGELAEYAAMRLDPHIVTLFDYEQDGTKIKFIAYLFPPAREGQHDNNVANGHNLHRTTGNGGSIDPDPGPQEFHLIPPAPDPPGDGVIG